MTIEDVKAVGSALLSTVWEGIVNDGRVTWPTVGQFRVLPDRKRVTPYHIIFDPHPRFYDEVWVGRKRLVRDLALRKIRMEKAGYDLEEDDCGFD